MIGVIQDPLDKNVMDNLQVGSNTPPSLDINNKQIRYSSHLKLDSVSYLQDKKAETIENDQMWLPYRLN